MHEYAALAGVNDTVHKMTDEYTAVVEVSATAHKMADEYATLTGVKITTKTAFFYVIE
ncbi:MAG: hypothetical protein VB061_06800 [Christensenella sp.]|nr:hypothetical protein [Christensenella sp.]